MRALAIFGLAAVFSVQIWAADTRSSDARSGDIPKANGSRVADAVQNGDSAALKALLTQKADVNATQMDGSSALLWAAQNDDVDAAKLLLGAGADAKTANRYGVTPLSEAAVNGNAAMVELLLKAGADANTTLPAGDTVLMLASKTGRTEAVKALLDHGAKVNAKEDWHGESALMLAAGDNHGEVVKLLLEHGADANAKATHLVFPEMKKGNAQVFSVYPAGGLTALMQAARNNGFDAASALLDGKANPNEKDPQGLSAAMIAILNGHWEMAKMLIHRGSDPNDGALPLTADVKNLVFLRPAQDRPETSNAMEVIKELLAMGAKADSVLPGPIPVLHNFGTNVRGSADSTALFRAAKAGDLEVMKLLIEHGANAARVLKDDSTVLHAAVGIGVPNPMGDAALDGPSQAQLIESIKFLLYHGADINAADGTGRTPLHGAAAKGTDEIVQYLAERGAKLDAKDKRDRTALDVAMASPGKGAGPMDLGGGLRQQAHPTTAALLRKLMGLPAEEAAPATGTSAKNEAADLKDGSSAQ